MKNLVIYLAALIIAIPGKAQEKEYARGVIEVLASPEFKGRGYVGNGHMMAARYIAGEFSKNGLEGLFNTNYFQRFPISINSFPSKMQLDIDGVRLAPGSEYLVHPASPSCKGNFSTFYIEKSQLTSPDIISTIVREAQGKIIIIDSRAEADTDREDAKKAGELINFLSFSEKIPSAGTVIITNEKLTWSISKHRVSKPVFTVKSDRVSARPSEIRVNIKSYLSEHQAGNVAGYIPGTGSRDSFILIIAHYDHLGKMGKEAYFPGANDNASGVSMLLSLARYFKNNPHRYSMAFIAMAAEESGLDGSAYFTEHPPFDLKKTVFLLNFDLAGTGDEGIKVVNGTEYEDKFKLLSDLNSASGYLQKVQKRGPACNSDHCFFYQKGVPCFYIYTLGGSTYYHDINDKPVALPLSEFADYYKLMIEFIQSIRHAID